MTSPKRVSFHVVRANDLTSEAACETNVKVKVATPRNDGHMSGTPRPTGLSPGRVGADEVAMADAGSARAASSRHGAPSGGGLGVQDSPGDFSRLRRPSVEISCSPEFAQVLTESDITAGRTRDISVSPLPTRRRANRLLSADSSQLASATEKLEWRHPAAAVESMIGPMGTLDPSEGIRHTGPAKPLSPIAMPDAGRGPKSPRPRNNTSGVPQAGVGSSSGGGGCTKAGSGDRGTARRAPKRVPHITVTADPGAQSDDPDSVSSASTDDLSPLPSRRAVQARRGSYPGPLSPHNGHQTTGSDLPPSGSPLRRQSRSLLQPGVTTLENAQKARDERLCKSTSPSPDRRVTSLTSRRMSRSEPRFEEFLHMAAEPERPMEDMTKQFEDLENCRYLRTAGRQCDRELTMDEIFGKEKT